MITILPTSLQRIILLYIDDIETLLCQSTNMDELKWLDDVIKPSERHYFRKFHDDIVRRNPCFGEWLVDKYNLTKFECREMFVGFIYSGKIEGVNMLKLKFDLSKFECMYDIVFHRTNYDFAVEDGNLSFIIWCYETFKLTRQEVLGENLSYFKKIRHNHGQDSHIAKWFISTFNITADELIISTPSLW